MKRGWRRCRWWLVAVAGVLALVWLLIPRAELLPPGLTWSRLVLDRHGRPLHVSTAADGRYRLRTRLAEIHPDWIEATLAKEDRWYRWHPGVNPVSLLRATWGKLGGSRAGGASTLTMQVARLRWSIRSSSVSGKLHQMLRAIQLERHYSKDEILEAYFNLAPYGGNVEGAGAAAWLWCGRDPSRVTTREAIALSVIPQSPSTRHPGVAGDSARLAVAQARLALLRENEQALREDPLAAEFLLAPPGSPPHEAPHYCRRLLRAHSDGVVRGTLDASLQHQVESTIRQNLDRLSEQGIVNACAILVHAPSREVLAYVGSADYANCGIHGMVDGLRARRSPGSAVKPFIYGLALDQGLIHPRSLLNDGPQNFHNYDPENFDGRFLGPLHADEALVRSRNLPAVALADRLEGRGLYGLLQDGGVVLPRSAEYYGLALALGGFEISPVELAGLYAALADDGLPRPLVYSTPPPPTPAVIKPLLSDSARHLVLEMLQGAAWIGADDGFGRADPSVAWKTGTSHGFRDAWAAGVRGPYVLIVWLGNFDGRGNNALIARRCAVPLLFNLFARLQLPAGPKRQTPEAVREVALCAVSGELPGPWCSRQSSGSFIAGVSPIAMCRLHREILVDGQSGLRVASDDGRPGLRREVHEFWPPEQLELFRQAGLPRRPPPPPEHGTDTLSGLDHGNAPEIVSPLAGRAYHLAGDEVISLRAKTAPGVLKCYWFCGEGFIGSGDARDVLPWRPQQGTHVLRVFDDHGRSAEMTVRVGN